MNYRELKPDETVCIATDKWRPLRKGPWRKLPISVKGWKVSSILALQRTAEIRRPIPDVEEYPAELAKIAQKLNCNPDAVRAALLAAYKLGKASK